MGSRPDPAGVRCAYRDGMDTSGAVPGADLYWLPLGAGGHSVRWNGRVYEWIAAHRRGRPPMALYHAALVVRSAHGRFVIEQAPVPRGDPAARGVVATGPVGTMWAGRFRVFRYEIRCWRDGVIPDIAEAVDSPRELTADPAYAARILALAPSVPRSVWGRDAGGTGEMWNSNSIIAWILTRAGIDGAAITPPAGGRAPGWRAGVMVAHR